MHPLPKTARFIPDHLGDNFKFLKLLAFHLVFTAIVEGSVTEGLLSESGDTVFVSAFLPCKECESVYVISELGGWLEWIEDKDGVNLI